MCKLNYPIQNDSTAGRKTGRSIIMIILGVVLLESSVQASELVVERRKDQFLTSPGRLIAPVPYSMPGIGDGFFLLGHFANAISTTGDLTVIKAIGDVEGYDVNIDEVPILDHHLFLRAELQDLSSVQQNYYDTRGMNTSKDDYTLLDISSYQSKNLGLDLTFFERRLTFSIDKSIANGELSAVRDPDGIIIADFPDPYKFDDDFTRLTFQLDLTDDYQDPRSGIRMNLRYQDHPAKTDNDPNFYVTELDVAFYQPMFNTDTLVLNYFQSDAHVKKKGNVDRDAIAEELGFNCDSTDAQCLSTEASVVDNFVNERSNGTATSLGGVNRFRAYPGERFSGAHVSTIGAEYRMNFERKSTPFNYAIWKDTHTGFQVAFFAEMGSVAETMDQLWDEKRYVVGSGLRLVTGSGAVYRFDLAIGDEGAQPNLFFYYPWN